jgi:NADH:ubiquinone oxidoreductase subunit 6 (subunit J)
MNPILFWLLGVFSIACGLIAILHKRPYRGAQGLVGLMGANAVIVFLLSSNLLGIEMLLVTLGGGVLAWTVIPRWESMKLGVPGLSRFSLAKLFAIGLPLALGVILWPVLLKVQTPRRTVTSALGLEAGYGGWTAAFLLGSAVCTMWLVFRSRRRLPKQEGET